MLSNLKIAYFNEKIILDKVRRTGLYLRQLWEGREAELSPVLYLASWTKLTFSFGVGWQKSLWDTGRGGWSVG
jgi:hypothetical protein